MIKVKDTLGIISMIIFVITLSIAVTIWFIPLYQITIQTQNIPESLGLTYDKLMDNYYALLQYLHFPWIQELNLPDFISSENGLLHFYEVKLLFYLNYSVLLIAFVSTFFYLKFVKRTGRIWVLIKPFFFASLIPPVLLFFLAVNFDSMFVSFHQIFFNNDAWIFNPATDPIINALPQDFFMYCFILFFILIETSFILGYQISKRKAFKTSK
ncbi:TIGR01906 family membrane protein [Marinilactibacillus psychrotolerans]|uniref:Membrane protein n=1 Tax=Marinilactibacillus psychrotolerans TaxID=191770 RepID=A0AAV3WS45_9LACT|nr:TIGR01906 family membrane protein [Marinilactibacillus psychrotolerans]GEL68115.1 membrane protein [Marinilactibacillus psychrotolerans]GEQ36829.1 membrane protein [Marinilactibacillus psychrotolerans]